MAYSKENINLLFDKILIRIELGEALRNVLKDEDLPSSKTFYEWLESDELKVKRYARACELRAEIIFDELIDIADDGRNDFMTKMLGGDVEIECLNSENIQRSRLRIDARKWILSKMNPKKYGDKLDIEQTNITPVTEIILTDAVIDSNT